MTKRESNYLYRQKIVKRLLRMPRGLSWTPKAVRDRSTYIPFRGGHGGMLIPPAYGHMPIPHVDYHESLTDKLSLLTLDRREGEGFVAFFNRKHEENKLDIKMPSLPVTPSYMTGGNVILYDLSKPLWDRKDRHWKTLEPLDEE